MVQAAGGQWRPLKDLLKMQDAAAKYTDQHDPSAPAPTPSTVLPLIPPPPRNAPIRPKQEPKEEPAPQPAAVESAPVLPGEPIVEEPEAPPSSFPQPEEPPPLAVS